MILSLENQLPDSTKKSSVCTTRDVFTRKTQETSTVLKSGREKTKINSQKSSHEEKKNEDGSGDAMVDKQNKFVGIFLAAVSGLFFTLCSVMVKLLKRIDPSEVLLFRAIVQFLITIPIMIYSKANPLGPKDLRILVYVQGVIGCLTVTCIFIGFAR